MTGTGVSFSFCSFIEISVSTPSISMNSSDYNYDMLSSITGTRGEGRGTKIASFLRGVFNVKLARFASKQEKFVELKQPALNLKISGFVVSAEVC
jgi:hypothetical protein